MKSYSYYTPVSLGWTDKIPKHWEAARLKRLLFERKENNDPIKTREILSLTNTRGVIPYAEKGNVGNKSKEKLEDYHLAYPNDLILNSMNVIIGSVGVSRYYGIRVGQWDLQMDKMKEIPFIVPPKDEQHAIVEYLKQTLHKSDVAIEKLIAEVDVLEEYKIKLIADTVTGKVDVRDIEVPAFEYVEETVDSSDEDDRDMGDASEDEEK